MASKRKASTIIEKFAKQPSSDPEDAVTQLVELGEEAAEDLIQALEHKAYQVRMRSEMARFLASGLDERRFFDQKVEQGRHDSTISASNRRFRLALYLLDQQVEHVAAASPEVPEGIVLHEPS